MKKTVYFVRHGESVLNIPETKIFENDEGAPLTDAGVAQTLKIAERAAKLPFEALIASPWARTRATAEAIAVRTGKTIEYSDLFVERKTPSSFNGLTRGSEEIKLRFREWERAFFEPDVRVEDGDNLLDVKTRALKALDYLRDRPENTILVSSHGFFLRVLLGVVIFGEELSPADFKKIYNTVLQAGNTALTVFQYDSPNFPSGKAADRWCLSVYNDQSHLG